MAAVLTNPVSSGEMMWLVELTEPQAKYMFYRIQIKACKKGGPSEKPPKEAVADIHKYLVNLKCHKEWSIAQFTIHKSNR